MKCVHNNIFTVKTYILNEILYTISLLLLFLDFSHSFFRYFFKHFFLDSFIIYYHYSHEVK